MSQHTAQQHNSSWNTRRQHSHRVTRVLLMCKSVYSVVTDTAITSAKMS